MHYWGPSHSKCCSLLQYASLQKAWPSSYDTLQILLIIKSTLNKYAVFRSLAMSIKWKVSVWVRNVERQFMKRRGKWLKTGQKSNLSRTQFENTMEGESKWDRFETIFRICRKGTCFQKMRLAAKYLITNSNNLILPHGTKEHNGLIFVSRWRLSC